MIRVYECNKEKKKELTDILENEPYAEDSFARVGYKVKDGGAIGEEESKTYVYINASEDFIGKADKKLEGTAKPCSEEDEKRIAEKIKSEEEKAQSGLGSIFGG